MCRYLNVEELGNWDSGPGVLDVSVRSANRAVSAIRVDCQCPCKVSQVHNRRKVLLPWVTGSLSSPIWQWKPKVSAFAEWRISFPSLENLAPCLFVCVCVSGRQRETGRQFVCVCVREISGVCFAAVWAVSAELHWMGSRHLLCLYTKKLFCF